MSIKLSIARAQLGTALSLFLRNKDPFSVHALACGGSEVIEGLADQNKIPTLPSHILQSWVATPMFDIAHCRKPSNFGRQAMLRFRHLALIFLFLSPAAAADDVPLEGSALLGDEGCASGLSHGRMYAQRAFA